MKNNFKILPFATLLLLAVLFIFACQKTEVTPVEKGVTTDANLKTLSDIEPEDCTDLFFYPLSDEEEEEIEAIGLDAFLAETDLGDGDDYALQQSQTANDYCNYVVVQVLNEGGGGPSSMYEFCVSCPPLCKKEGILFNACGYKARALREFMTGLSCTVCLPGRDKIKRKRQ
ncbi:MAG: hypothetical protein AB8G15_16660 [Saprospiraceae bacterium]